MKWDEDIALDEKLSAAEKDGVQYFRDFYRKVIERSEKDFSNSVDLQPADFSELEKLIQAVLEEDVRFLPIICCAYADELLTEAFKEIIPTSVPGGKNSILSLNGSLSNLFHRLQAAYVFEVVSREVVHDLDKLRKVRNKISHSWSVIEFNTFFENEPATQMFPIEEILAEKDYLKLSQQADLLTKFRIKVIWLMMRITYESSIYFKARSGPVNVSHALYGPNHPKRLGIVADVALRATEKLLNVKRPARPYNP